MVGVTVGVGVTVSVRVRIKLIKIEAMVTVRGNRRFERRGDGREVEDKVRAMVWGRGIPACHPSSGSLGRARLWSRAKAWSAATGADSAWNMFSTAANIRKRGVGTRGGGWGND